MNKANQSIFGDKCVLVCNTATVKKKICQTLISSHINALPLDI